jgi:type VI secretion system protein ImpA
MNHYQEQAMDQELLNRLIAPIAGDHPCGEDLSFSVELDEIREARRQDDATLAQGEWATELKVAQWPKVRRLCEDVLGNKSKDFQVACWYAEAMANLHGFQGMHFSMQLLEVMVTDFWEFFYPSFDPDDLEERAGKIEWLNRQMASTIRELPLTNKASGNYSWLKWSESREVDNLGLKDPDAKTRALANGKLAGEAFDKAAVASGLAFYQTLGNQIHAARSTLLRLEQHIDERFGDNSPSLKEFRDALGDCADVVDKLIAKFGGKVETGVGNPGAMAYQNTPAATSAAVAAPAHVVATGHIRSRDDAVGALRLAAQYFKHNEPHSPVALLAERAAKWAEMPLEQWLASVIKDEATLGQLRELLDIQAAG